MIERRSASLPWFLEGPAIEGLIFLPGSLLQVFWSIQYLRLFGGCFCLVVTQDRLVGFP